MLGCENAVEFDRTWVVEYLLGLEDEDYIDGTGFFGCDWRIRYLLWREN